MRALAGLIACLLALAALGPALAPAASDRDCITIENFAAGPVDAFPPGWRARKRAGERVYRILEEGPLRFLRAQSEGLGIQAAVQREWDLDAYPVLSWSWRPRVFPAGADERRGPNDSVLAVYLLVPYSRIVGPKAVKYVWSERVPVGTHLKSNAGLTQVRVLRSGSDERDHWVREQVNVRDDFRALFDVDTSPRPAGIAVLTDSDDTESRAEGDYADFRACRS